MRTKDGRVMTLVPLDETWGAGVEKPQDFETRYKILLVFLGLYPSPPRLL